MGLLRKAMSGKRYLLNEVAILNIDIDHLEVLIADSVFTNLRHLTGLCPDNMISVDIDSLIVWIRIESVNADFDWSRHVDTVRQTVKCSAADILIQSDINPHDYDIVVEISSNSLDRVSNDNPFEKAAMTAESAVIKDIADSYPKVIISDVVRRIDDRYHIHSYIFVKTDEMLRDIQPSIPRLQDTFRQVLNDQFEIGPHGRNRLSTDIRFDSLQNLLDNYGGSYGYYFR